MSLRRPSRSRTITGVMGRARRRVFSAKSIGGGLVVVGVSVLLIGWLIRGDAPSFDIGALITAIGIGTSGLRSKSQKRPDVSAD